MGRAARTPIPFCETVECVCVESPLARAHFLSWVGGHGRSFVRWVHHMTPAALRRSICQKTCLGEINDKRDKFPIPQAVTAHWHWHKSEATVAMN